ncbi:MAG: ECF transporter S component [bacterium]|nr:ECF transporter S component [bacterium]
MTGEQNGIRRLQLMPDRGMLPLVPVGIALNLGIGTVVHLLKLPLYLDAVGTIVLTMLAGPQVGVLVGVLSFLIGGILVNPVLPWFAGTQAAIAIYVHVVGRRGGFKTFPRSILSGLGLGLVAGIVSAPVIAMVFGGVTGSGASFIAALLLASGKNLLQSVVLSGLTAEPVDKTLQCLLAIWLIKGLPHSVRRRFRGGAFATDLAPERQ